MSDMKEVLIPVDNSNHSNYCISVGINLAKKFGSRLVGNHVYAAKLHDDRFAQMESGLPPKYQEPGELQKQRDIHDSLITQGLELISEAFLDYFAKECDKAGVEFGRKIMEGKNYYQIVKDINDSDYSLVILGAFGLGALHKTSIGSVTSRVSRRSKSNVFVVRESDDFSREIVVCVDGSAKSFAAVRLCAIMAKKFNVPLKAISVFDPQFHVTAFRSIAGVLSKEAGEVFKFEEQEKLHDEIIDKGLEKIYQAHLDTAKKVASELGVEMETKLLDGRAVEKVLEYVEKANPSFVAVGRTGIHSDNGLDMGAVSENLLMGVKCNLLIVADEFVPPEEDSNGVELKELPWSDEALERIARIPEFVRNMAKKAIVDYARGKGCETITAEVVNEARKSMGM